VSRKLTVPKKVRDRVRRSFAAFGGWVPTCPPCGEFIEDCACVCPWCGERSGCRCAIGYGLATGGG